MNLPFKPHVLALICSAGILAASGVLYVKSRTPAVPETPPAEAPAPVAPAAAPVAAPVAATYTTAQIDQWVAPVALYPDALLSQVLMASTYPANVVQAVQWSQDNPTMQGDAAVQAVANQPWDPSVKSLVAFPQLLALMGEDPQWVQNLGNAFLAQPQDVMDSVQKLRALAQQTGALKSTPQQTVVSTPKTVVSTSSSSSTTVVKGSTTTQTAPQVIKIESTNPQVVYVPTYNPSTVYGTWPSTTYPPVYLPPPPGEQFANSFVNGLGFSLGVATTYALFSSIDWDDDHHHDDDHHDDYHHDDGYHGGGYSHNGDNNININVNNYNHITGQTLHGNNVSWQHNPAYRNGVPYPNNNVAQHFHQTNVAGGLSATRAPVPASAPNRDSQRQAAMAQLQQRTGTPAFSGARNAQGLASSQQLHQIAQRNNFRGYDNPSSARQNASNVFNHATQQPLRTQAGHNLSGQQQHLPAQQQHLAAQQRRLSEPQQQRQASLPQHQNVRVQNPQRQQAFNNVRANALSGNESRSFSWQAQQQRGQASRNLSSIHNNGGGIQPRQSEHPQLHRLR